MYIGRYALCVIICAGCITSATFAADNNEPPRKRQKTTHTTASDFIAAINNGDFISAQQYLEDGFDATFTNNDGETVLHILAGKAYPEDTAPLFIPDFITQLVRNGAPVDAQKEDTQETALHYAADQGNLKVIKALLENGADPNISNMPDPSSENLYSDTPLHYAVYNRDIDAVRILLAYGANVSPENAYTMTPLHIASRNGYIDIMKLLINNNAQINDSKPIVTRTIQPEPSQTNGSDHDTSYRRSITYVERDPVWEITPLHAAAGDDQVEAVKLLIAHGAAVDAESDEDKLTPLHYFARYGTNQNIAKVLLDNGANVNKMTIDGATPLHLLAEANLDETNIAYIIRDIGSVLLQYKANINAQHHAEGNETTDTLPTPLHTAVSHENFEMTKFLLMHGANPNTTDVERNTPLDIAYENEYQDVIHVIEVRLDQAQSISRLPNIASNQYEAVVIGKYALGQNNIDVAEYITKNVADAHKTELILHATVLQIGGVAHADALQQYIQNMSQQFGINNIIPGFIAKIHLMMGNDTVTTPLLSHVISQYTTFVNAYRDYNNNTLIHYIAHDPYLDHAALLNNNISISTLYAKNNDQKTARDIAHDINNTAFINAYDQQIRGMHMYQTPQLTDVDIALQN